MRATVATFSVNPGLAIRAVEWFRNGQHLLAAGDDGVARVWDLGLSVDGVKSKPLVEFKGHGDCTQMPVGRPVKFPLVRF